MVQPQKLASPSVHQPTALLPNDTLLPWLGALSEVSLENQKQTICLLGSLLGSPCLRNKSHDMSSCFLRLSARAASRRFWPSTLCDSFDSKPSCRNSQSCGAVTNKSRRSYRPAYWLGIISPLMGTARSRHCTWNISAGSFSCRARQANGGTFRILWLAGVNTHQPLGPWNHFEEQHLV